MFPDKRPTLYAAVRWLTAAWIVLSTHGFWLENVLIVTVSVAWSVSMLTKLNATSVNSLTSAELARNMSQSTSSRDACSIASEWEDQRVTSLSPGDSWTLLCTFYIFTFTFMHLADAFIQSDLHCIQVTVLHFISSCFPWESNPWSWRC